MEERLTETSRYRLKKLVSTLKKIKGRHTELVTVYVPVGYNIHEIMSQLKQEQGTAENIKSKQVRKNVTTALEKIIRHLQLYKKTPEHGLAIFCGNVSEKEGVTEMDLWAIEPPEPVKVKLYWCDQKFDTQPLEDMMKEKEVYGIICLDKSEADIGTLKGKKIESITHKESIVPGKTRAGGQSSARFSRIREGLLNDWLKEIGETANKIFEEHKEILGILVGGPGPIKDIFLKEDYLHAAIKNKVIGTVDTSYTGEYGLHETVERGQDLIKESAVIKEKNILQRFFNELQKTGGLVTYGLKDVMKALEMGAVDSVILSESLTLEEVEYECACGLKKKFVKAEEKNSQKCEKCNHLMKIIGEKDVIEAFEELVNNYGTGLIVVSSETREGKQFEDLGGIGAILRYRID